MADRSLDTLTGPCKESPLSVTPRLTVGALTEEGTDLAKKSFFVAPQPAAVLKHGILRRYVTVFASKTGAGAPGKKVVYLDGYAGPGRYDGGEPGSPALAIESARNVADYRRLHCIFVEENAKHHKALAAMLAEEAGDDLITEHHRGKVEEHLPAILQGHQQEPLFAFLDPFGLGIGFDTLTGLLLARKATTEVLLNFTVPGLERVGGFLDSAKTIKNRDATLERMDQVMGGDWWREIYRSATGPERLDQIVSGYRDRLSATAGGWGGWVVPVFDKVGGHPEYLLLHFTRHPDGRWEFHEALSAATQEWRVACAKAAGPTEEERLAALGMIPFEGMESPIPFEDDEAAWVDEIAVNLRSLVAQGVAFVVQDRMTEVFGRTLGIARAKHVRTAVKRLYKEGVTSTPGTGHVQTMVIRPPAST